MGPIITLLGLDLVLVWYIFTKAIKRVGLYRRDPFDILFLPLTILFGFGHGIIKIIALFTWNVTSWGNRPDGDINDAERMTPRVLPAEVMANPTADSQVLVRYTDEAQVISEKKEDLEPTVDQVD